MKPPSPPEFLFHPKFGMNLDEVEDSVVKNAIQSKLKKVQENPAHFTSPLRGPLAGDREIRVLQDLRIIVTFCWECVQTGHQHKHKCPCDKIPENTIIVWWMGNHKEMKRAQGVTSLPWPDDDRPRE